MAVTPPIDCPSVKPVILYPAGPVLSPICLGGSTFGRENDESVAFQLMDYAVERGHAGRSLNPGIPFVQVKHIDGFNSQSPGTRRHALVDGCRGVGRVDFRRNGQAAGRRLA
jgi:hypothetical protein